MSEANQKQYTMAVGTTVLESTMIEGENYYTTTVEEVDEEEPEEAQTTDDRSDLNSLCRICATTNDYFIPIFDGEGVSHNLKTKVDKYLPIKVSVTDTLPVQVCYNCASALITWDTLVTTCLEADTKLRALQQQETEEEAADDSKNDDMEVFDTGGPPPSDDADSDDEPLIPSKAKKEKTPLATPLKKKILSKTKSKASSSTKPVTSTKIKEDVEDKESDDDVPLNAIDVNTIKNNHHEKIHCSICNLEMTKKSYSRHVKNVHQNDDIKSEDNKTDILADAGDINPCEMLFKVEVSEGTAEQLAKKMSNNPTGVACTICNQVYSSHTNLKKHIYNVHQMKKVQCSICEKVVNKKSYDRHMFIVHGASHSKKERKPIPDDQKIPCHLCDKKCTSFLNLQNHIKSIHEAQQYKCDKCEFRGIKRILDKHVKKEHNEEIYQCNQCSKVLKSKSTLKEHQWIHTEHRRFICDICGMRFKRTSNYHGHLKSHQEKKFQCHLCGHFFLRKRYLAVHQQTIHSYYGEGVQPQEKGFQCEVCGVKLKWKNNLMAHMRIHTGERPYKCQICKDEFTCHGSLRTHLSKHAICPTTPDVSSMFLQHAYLQANNVQPQSILQ